MSIFINKKTGKLVTADSKNEVLALNVDRLSWKVKELYNKLNKGDFEYNYRVDEDFQKFIDTTVCDEIKDIIRSSKQLINDCVGKRIKTHSIVWKCMGLIFDEVKERNGLATTYNSETIKNWFAFNNTDYKTALKNVISDIDDFRDELRETEKSSEVKSVAKVPKTKVKELCDLVKSDKKVADSIVKDLTSNYNCELDYVLATRYLVKTFGQKIDNSSMWVKHFKQLYNENGSKFLCKVLNDLVPGIYDSEISGGSSGFIISYLYKKYCSNKVTASITISCEKGLDNLEGKIKEFKKLLTRITSFIARRKSKYKYIVEDDVFGSTECSHIWRITNNEGKSISIKLTLDDGFTTYNVKCFVRYGRDSYSQTQNPWKYIEDFLD